MFTGLVERTGKVVSLVTTETGDGITQLIVDAGRGFETKIGDSVSVNGCCLTVTSNKVQMLAFDLSSETLKRTSLGRALEGTEVNLERAMKLGDRLGGHLVSGHVDGLGRVDRILKKTDGWELRIHIPRALARYVIAKGSVCLDGVSLTINSVQDDEDGARIGLMLIPTTVSLTALKFLEEGMTIAVEVDPIGKYVERLIGPYR